MADQEIKKNFSEDVGTISMRVEPDQAVGSDSDSVSRVGLWSAMNIEMLADHRAVALPSCAKMLNQKVVISSSTTRYVVIDRDHPISSS